MTPLLQNIFPVRKKEVHCAKYILCVLNYYVLLNLAKLAVAAVYRKQIKQRFTPKTQIHSAVCFKFIHPAGISVVSITTKMSHFLLSV